MPNPYGRPPAKDPKNVQLKVMISKDLDRAILRYCLKHQTIKSDLVRRGILLAMNEKK